MALLLILCGGAVWAQDTPATQSPVAPQQTERERKEQERRRRREEKEAAKRQQQQAGARCNRLHKKS
jgi:hypothetical protein